MQEREVRTFLARLYEIGQQHDAREPEHSKRWRNLDPATAQLLHILIRSTRRTRLLEIGTSNGYSTIWQAWAAQGTGGRLTSIERNAPRQAQADENLRQAGLRQIVDLVCGDANEVLATLPGPFDWVFFDADRYDAGHQLALLVPKLAPDVFVLADNVLSHPNEVTEYLKVLDTLPLFDRLIVPIGKGLSLAYRQNGQSRPI